MNSLKPELQTVIDMLMTLEKNKGDDGQMLPIPPEFEKMCKTVARPAANVIASFGLDQESAQIKDNPVLVTMATAYAAIAGPMATAMVPMQEIYEVIIITMGILIANGTLEVRNGTQPTTD